MKLDGNSELQALRAAIADLERRLDGAVRTAAELPPVREQLSNCEARCQALLATTPAAVVLCDPEGRISDVSPPTLRLCGFEQREDLIGRSLFSLVASGNIRKARRAVREGLAQGRVKKLEITLVRRDGTRFRGQFSATLIRDEQGEPVQFLGTLKDISTPRPEEETIRESEERYRGLMNSAPIGIAIHQDGKIVLVNRYLMNILEYTAESELLGKPIMDLVHPDFRETVIRRIRSMAESGDYAPLNEEKLLKKDGTSLYALIAAAPITYRNRPAFEASVLDLTEFKKAQRAGRESEERFRTFFRDTLDAIYIISAGGRILEVNQALLDLFGYTRREIGELDPRLLYVDPEQRKPFLQKIYRQGYVKNYPLLLKTKQGTPRYCLETASVRRDYQGRVIGHQGIIRDRTEQVLAREELQESEEKFRSLTNSAPDAIIGIDHKGQIQVWNPAAARMFGYPAREALGRNLYALITPPGYQREAIKNLKEFLQTKQKRKLKKTLEMNVRHRNGMEFPVELSISRYQAHGKWHATGVIRDITERKQYQRQLEQALEKAQQGEKVKTLFLANMSHEIRTPLNAIIGFTDLIEASVKSKVSPEVQTYFKVIAHSGERLIRTVHEILDISQLEAGALPLAPKALDLVTVTRTCVDELNHSAYSKGLRFRFHTKLPEARIKGDEYSVSQAIFNIVDNAIKYTPVGRVDIRLTRREKTFVLTIRDTGIGMSREFMKKMYELFTQESDGYGKKFQGVGLGLSLAKRYLDLNQVDVRVRSTKNKGTTFTLSFTPAAG